MKRVIVLDSFPLSCVGKQQGRSSTLTDRCRNWVIDAIRAGYSVRVPAIVYYEVLRELERLNATAQIVRLKAFLFTDPQRFIPLTTEHLERAASLWAQSRNTGISRANDSALDGDVLLCAQALGLGLTPEDFVVATTNVRHLSSLVPAQAWDEIIL